MQLGFKPRAARAALEEVCAHVGADADVASLVKTALDRERNANAAPDKRRHASRCCAGDHQLGYTRAVAMRPLPQRVPTWAQMRSSLR